MVENVVQFYSNLRVCDVSKTKATISETVSLPFFLLKANAVISDTVAFYALHQSIREQRAM